jgi:ribonuclease P protein component
MDFVPEWQQRAESGFWHAVAQGDASACRPDPRVGAIGLTLAAMKRLKKRAEFLFVAGGARYVCEAFVLQARRGHGDPGAGPRSGFTASRKVGNAVERNRARRRLKEAARQVLDKAAIEGHDYVLVARHAAVSHPFADILIDLGKAVQKVHYRIEAGDCGGQERKPRRRRHGGPGASSTNRRR